MHLFRLSFPFVVRNVFCEFCIDVSRFDEWYSDSIITGDFLSETLGESVDTELCRTVRT